MTQRKYSTGAAQVYANYETRKRVILAFAIAAAQQRRPLRRAGLHETPRERDARLYGVMGVKHAITRADRRNDFTPPAQFALPPMTRTGVIIVYDDADAYAAIAKIPINTFEPNELYDAHYNDDYDEHKYIYEPFFADARITLNDGSTLRLPMKLVYDKDVPDEVLRIALETGVTAYRVLYA